MGDKVTKNYRRPEEEAEASPPTSGFEKYPQLNRSGRKPGSQNRITKTFKEAAERAFEQGGGVEWLVGLMHGTASDRAAVMGLYGRLIPAQLQAQVDTTVRVELAWLGNRGIGRVTEEDVKSLDIPQANGQITHKNQDVVEGEIIGEVVSKAASVPVDHQMQQSAAGAEEGEV